MFVLSVLFGLVGVWLTLLNWHIFWKGIICKQKTPSWIPILPGGFLCSAIYLFPDNPYRVYCWIGFLIDWGCIPGLMHTFWYILFEGTANNDSQSGD